MRGHLPHDAGGQERAIVVRGLSQGTMRAKPSVEDVSRRPVRRAASREKDLAELLAVAPSRFEGGGRGLFARCSAACSRHPTRKFFSSSVETRQAEYAQYMEVLLLKPNPLLWPNI